MDFKSLLSKIDDLHEDSKPSGSFDALKKSVGDRAAADAAAKQKHVKPTNKEPKFDTSALASKLGGKLPKREVGVVSRTHKTPDFDTDDEDDGSEIVREMEPTRDLNTPPKPGPRPPSPIGSGAKSPPNAPKQNPFDGAKLTESGDPITAFASKAHEEWRRGYDPTGTKPRIKKNSDGTEGDINKPFDEIHPDWQRENLAAGKAAYTAVKNFGNDIEAAAKYIHDEWMKRNPKGDWNAAQHVPYEELPDSEKEKDRVHVRTMMQLLGTQDVTEGSEDYQEIFQMNTKQCKVGAVVQYNDGKFGFIYGNKLSPVKFDRTREAQQALNAHHNKQDVAEGGPKITHLPYMGPKASFYTLTLRDGTSLKSEDGFTTKRFDTEEQAKKVQANHPGSTIKSHDSNRIPVDRPDGRIEPHLFEKNQPRNLKEWMNRVENKQLDEEQVKAPVAVMQAGKPVPATITSTSTKPGDTNVLQAAAKILAAGGGQIQMAPSADTTQPTSTQSTAQPTSKQSTAQPTSSTVQPVSEEEIDEVAAPGQEDWIKDNKQRFIDQYGKKKGLSVLYATAWKRSKGKKKSMNESKQIVSEGYTLEDILQRYPHESKVYEDGWGTVDESLYEALRDYYFENGFIPRKVMYGDSETCREHVMDCYNKDRGLLMDESIQTASSGDAQMSPLSEINDEEILDENPLAVGAIAAGARLGAGLGGAAARALGGGTTAQTIGSGVGGAFGGQMASDAVDDLTSESLYELDELDDLDEPDLIDEPDDEFPFPDDMEDDDELNRQQAKDMEYEDDLLDEEFFMESKKKKLRKHVSEETKETKTGRVHKAEPGGYGRKDDEDDDGKKVKKPKDAPKRGRGRPKKDADSETGEVKKWDTDTLARWIVGSKPKTLPGKASVKHKIKDESAKRGKKDPQMESWDRELKALLNEGMTVTTSTGQNGMGDSVSVSATDADAAELMKVLSHAGIGIGSGMKGGIGHDHMDGGQAIEVEPVAHDEVMSQLQPQDDDGGADPLDFIKRMMGARGGDNAMVVDVAQDGGSDDYEAETDHDHDEEGCDECGHSPCDCEEEVDEGNKFTGELAKARADGVQKGETISVDGKKYPVKPGKKMDEEKDHEDSDEDDEDSDDHEDEDKEKVDEEMCNECGGAMYEGHQCESEELTEWANSPMGKSADESFRTELEYMTKLISGGLNNQKVDQTILPHTKVKTEIVKEDISATMKKLAGIK